MLYDPVAIASYFDSYGEGEWVRLVATPGQEVILHIHECYLRRHILPGSRVLEIGAGPGRFTQILADLGCRVVVADISPVQLGLNRIRAAELGFASAVESWEMADICDLVFPDDSFDAVLAYGGPISYALDRAGDAVRSCSRVTIPGGVVLASVISLWGSIHGYLPPILRLPADNNRAIIASGDLTSATAPDSRENVGHYCHLFRLREVRPLFENNDLEVIEIAASNALSNAIDDQLAEFRAIPERWSELLEMELEASEQPGCLEMGNHIIVAARKSFGGHWQEH